MSGRLQLRRAGLVFDYRRTARNFLNQYLNNEPWHIREEWFVFINLVPKLLARDSLEHDGHSFASATILGIEFGKGYTYDSRPATAW